MEEELMVRVKLTKANQYFCGLGEWHEARERKLRPDTAPLVLARRFSSLGKSVIFPNVNYAFKRVSSP